MRSKWLIIIYLFILDIIINTLFNIKDYILSFFGFKFFNIYYKSKIIKIITIIITLFIVIPYIVIFSLPVLLINYLVSIILWILGININWKD